MDLFCFLGIPKPKKNAATGVMEEGSYEETTYCRRWPEGDLQEFKTHLFPLALDDFYHPDRLYLLVTEKARQHHHYQEIADIMGDRLKPVPISDGKNEEQLWEIFQQVTEAVEPETEVVFDITHGFRSLPFIVFLAIAYLQKAKGVKVRSVVYGNYEARDNNAQKTPVFDISPFVVLLDWLTAVSAMKEEEDARQIAELLGDLQNNIYRNRGRANNHNLPHYLKNAGNNLGNLSEALHLARPVEIMKQSASLRGLLASAEDEIAALAKPFAVLLEDINKNYSRYIVEKPELLTKENLAAQVKMVKCYVEKNMVMQAVSLAREWVVSLLIYSERSEHDWLNKKETRDKAEEQLNSAAMHKIAGYEISSQEVPFFDEIVDTWIFIRNLRNDIDHCGMREQTAELNSIIKNINKIPEKLQPLLDCLDTSYSNR